MSGDRSSEGTLNLNLTTDILENRTDHSFAVVAKAIETGERHLREEFVRRAAFRQAETSPQEDQLEQLIDASFEYLCAQMGVGEAERLCRSMEQ